MRGEPEPNAARSGVDAALPAPLFALTSNTWTLKAPFPAVFGAIGLSAGVFPNAAGQSIVYTFGGTDGGGGSGVAIGAYNIGTNVWTSKGYENRVYVFNTNGVGRIGSKLYFSGGRDYGNGYDAIVAPFWAYDPATNTLTQKANMPKATAEGVTGVIDGKLYVLPGNCSTDYIGPTFCPSEPTRQLFRYSPTTNFWTWKRPAPHYHANGAGGVINGQFYVAGGIDNSLDRYDPATDTWKTLAPLPTGGAARGAVLLGKFYVITSGGAYAYNPATNMWSAKARPRYSHDAVVAITIGAASPSCSRSAASGTPRPSRTSRRTPLRSTRLSATRRMTFSRVDSRSTPVEPSLHHPRRLDAALDLTSAQPWT